MKYKNNLRYKGSLLDKFVHAVLYYDYESPDGLSEEEKNCVNRVKGTKSLKLYKRKKTSMFTCYGRLSCHKICDNCF